MKTVARITVLIVCASSCGCANSLISSLGMEQRVIEQFADALAEENEPALKRISSTKFEQTAERSGDILNDLRAIKLPKSEVSVVEVNEIDDAHREVVVKEKSGGKYQFHLVYDEAKKYWTVDDVIVRQRKKGTRSAKSTTEVLELLLTLREFLKVWESGERNQILAMTSPKLSQSLAPLPDSWLQSLTHRIASNYEKGMARKPEANLGDKSAVVKLPAKNGHLLLSLVRNENGWQVEDVEAQNHREEHHPGSVKRQADAINTVSGFLMAYAKEDRESLKSMTVHEFYDGSLKVADLSLIELPSAQTAPKEFDIRAYENKLTFIIPFGRELVRVDLSERENSSSQVTVPSRFQVLDVTLYDRSTQRQRALSSLFTAPTRASVFLKALAQGNEDILLQLSTPDFARGTWARASSQLLQQLNRPDFYSGELKLTDSQTVGHRTELEFEAGNGLVVHCQLVNQNGQLRVDDVQYPNERGEITSLKTQLELSVPLVEFANAWKSGDMTLVQKSCSTDFNRLVWSHLNGIPTRYGRTPEVLQMAPAETRVTPERATVTCRNGKTEVVASLVQERDYWVVDEIKVPLGKQIVGIRSQLRTEIADKIFTESYSTRQLADGRQIVKPFVDNDTFDQNLKTAQNTTVPAMHAELTPPQRVPTASIAENSALNKPTHQMPSRNQIQRVSGHKSPPTGFIQGNISHGGVRPAVFTQSFDATGQGQEPNPFRLANQSKVKPDVSKSSTKQSLDKITTIHQPTDRPASVIKAAGMTVFGPDAAAVGRKLKGEKPASTDLPLSAQHKQPLDLTQSTATKLDAPKNSQKSAKNNLMYFGPDKDRLKSGNPKTTSQQSMTKPRLTQPADMPIPVK